MDAPEHGVERERPDDARSPARKLPDPAKTPSAQEQLDLVGRVLDLLPDFFYVHDYDLRFFYANQKAATYFGLRDKAELVGRTLEDVDSDKQQARAIAELCRKIMDQGQPRTTDNIPYRRPDGSVGVLRQHDIPFSNPKTGKKMLIGLSRDVTIERELEAQRTHAAALERELDIARRIQASLRPDQQAIQSGVLSLAGYSQPAAWAGGDFYDWFPTRDGRIAVCMGDVTGHGVGPALLASECRAYARVLLATQPLERAMDELDGLLAHDLRDGRFITFAAIVVDPATGSGEVFSAGQGPLLKVSQQGGEVRVSELPVARAPLGLGGMFAGDGDEGRAEGPARFALGEGECVLLISDGLYEARNARGEMYGLARLAELLERRSTTADSAASDALVGELEASLREFVGTEAISDDVTIVCVGRGHQRRL